MNTVIKLFLFFALIGLIFSVFYYSWLPQPSFKSEKYLPTWLVIWTDTNGIIRTSVPFFLLGFIGSLLRNNEFSSKKLFLILMGVLLLAELGQLFLPNRKFDVLDIVAGMLATIVGQLAGLVFKKVLLKRV